jgi:type II secretory pathway pseudopilin PulG
MTLLELLAVVVVLGILAAITVGRLAPNTLYNVGAQTDAQRLAVDLLQARQRSIATGENHYLDFTTGGGGTATGYTLYRRSASQGDVAVDEPHQFPSDVVVSVSHSNAEFTFEGAALAAYQITLTGPDQTWRVEVVTVTGTARVRPVVN